MIKDFKRLHPIVLFIYFFSVLCLTIFYRQPVCIVIVCICSLIVLKNVDTNYSNTMRWYIVFYLIMALTNPLFIQFGADIIYQGEYLTITKQALVYGFLFAGVLVSILALCKFFSQVITSEEIVYVFSNKMPVIGMLVMLIFRLTTKFKRQAIKINEAQTTLGLGVSQGNIFRRAASLKDQFLILFTWAFESSLDMYCSMKARGYQNTRSHFHIFQWKRKDTMVLSVILVLDVVLSIGYFRYQDFYYYPIMATITLDLIDLLFYSSCCCLVVLPLLIGRNRYV